MSLVLNKLELTNITKYANKTVEFKPGLNIIYGPDGSGKSSIIKSIHGVTSGKIDKDLLSVNANIGNIKLGVNIGEKQRVLERNITPGKSQNSGMSTTNLVNDLGINVNTLEMINDTWSIMTKSEKALFELIDKAVTKTITKDELVKQLKEGIEPSNKTGEILTRVRQTSNIVNSTNNAFQKSLKDLEKEEVALTDEIHQLQEDLSKAQGIDAQKIASIRKQTEDSNRLKALQERYDSLIKNRAEATTKLEKLNTKLEEDKNNEFVNLKVDELNINLGKLQSQLDETNRELNAVHDVDLSDASLSCQWFGKCLLENDNLIKTVSKIKDDNTQKREKLEVVKTQYTKDIAELKTKIETANTYNQALALTNENISRAQAEITNLSSQIKELEDAITELKKVIPETIESIDDAVFLVVESAKENQAKLTNATNRLTEVKQYKEAYTKLAERMAQIVSSLKTNTIDFEPELKSSMEFIFNKEIESNINSIKVEDVPINNLSMSEKQRTGIVLQYVTSKVTGLNLLILDNINVITDYKRLGAFITDMVNDGFQIILATSLLGVEQFVKTQYNLISTVEPEGEQNVG